MAVAARWIRTAPDGAEALRAGWRGFARAQAARAAPAAFWAREADGGFAFGLVVPLRLLPGRAWRWREWALAPAIATYRLFGERAYLDGGALWLAGAPIAGCDIAPAGDCALFSSGFLAELRRPHAGWTERGLEAAFRGRLEAQHGWQFDNGWPTAAEHEAIAGAQAGESVDAP
jgi:hypothetical protein